MPIWQQCAVPINFVITTHDLRKMLISNAFHKEESVRQSLACMLASKARALRSAVRGNALLTTTFMLVPLIGMIGLGTDTAQWYLWKEQLQGQADSAALAGAHAVAQGKSGTALVAVVNADLALNRDRPFQIVAIENAPKAGAKAGNAKAVRVVLSTQEPLPFSSLFLRSPPVIQATATAELSGESNPTCILSLMNTTGTGIAVSGTATIDLGCGMMSNSRGSSSLTTGGGRVDAVYLGAAGSIVKGTGVTASTVLMPNQASMADPFSSVPDPVAWDDDDDDGVTVDSRRTVNLRPGFYKELEVKGTANLAPGTYYIAEGGLTVRGGAVINGDGVTIVLTSRRNRWDPASVGDLDVAGDATVNLVAPTTGPYAGLVVYRDRRAQLESGSAIKMSGNSDSRWQGSVYGPSSRIAFTGNTGLDTDCSQIVGYTVSFSGRSSFRNICPVGSLLSAFDGSGLGGTGTGAAPRLVE